MRNPTGQLGQAHVSESLKLGWHQRRPGSQTDWGVRPGVQATRPSAGWGQLSASAEMLPVSSAQLLLSACWPSCSRGLSSKGFHSRSDFYSLQRHAWAPSPDWVPGKASRWSSHVISDEYLDCVSTGPWQSAGSDFSTHKTSFPSVGASGGAGDGAGTLRFVFA